MNQADWPVIRIFRFAAAAILGRESARKAAWRGPANVLSSRLEGSRRPAAAVAALEGLGAGDEGVEFLKFAWDH